MDHCCDSLFTSGDYVGTPSLKIGKSSKKTLVFESRINFLEGTHFTPVSGGFDVLWQEGSKVTGPSDWYNTLKKFLACLLTCTLFNFIKKIF